MKIDKYFTFLPLSLSILLFYISVSEAHHSHANLNRDDIRTYSGVVTRYSWTMPHVFLKVRAPDKKGNVVEYSIEMLHPPAWQNEVGVSVVLKKVIQLPGKGHMILMNLDIIQA